MQYIVRYSHEGECWDLYVAHNDGVFVIDIFGKRHLAWEEAKKLAKKARCKATLYKKHGGQRGEHVDYTPGRTRNAVFA